MYLKNKKTGEVFCHNKALFETGKYEEVESLAPTEAPAAPVKPGPKPRQPKDK